MAEAIYVCLCLGTHGMNRDGGGLVDKSMQYYSQAGKGLPINTTHPEPDAACAA